MQAEQPHNSTITHKSPNWHLNLSLTPTTLNLTLLTTLAPNPQTYTASISSLAPYPTILFYCESLADVFELMRDPGNLEVDWERASVVLVITHPMKKDKRIELAVFTLARLGGEGMGMGMGEIVARCEDGSDLTNKDIKGIIKHLVLEIQSFKVGNSNK